jgi:hypothetical protein
MEKTRTWPYLSMDARQCCCAVIADEVVVKCHRRHICYLITHIERCEFISHKDPIGGKDGLEKRINHFHSRDYYYHAAI